MRSWANVGRDGECAIDNIKDVMSGNVHELKSYVSHQGEPCPPLARCEGRQVSAGVHSLRTREASVMTCLSNHSTMTMVSSVLTLILMT